MSVLGNPKQRTPLTITDVAQAVTLPLGLMSIQIQNTGSKDCYIGDADVDDTNGMALYSAGDRMSFENCPSDFTFYLICTSGETTTVRLLDYK